MAREAAGVGGGGGGRRGLGRTARSSAVGSPSAAPFVGPRVAASLAAPFIENGCAVASLRGEALAGLGGCTGTFEGGGLSGNATFERIGPGLREGIACEGMEGAGEV